MQQKRPKKLNSTPVLPPDVVQSLASSSPPTLPYIGGQAVLEGVMMRAPGSFAVAVRKADGSILVRERPMVPDARRWVKWPLIRGVMSLVESLKLGAEALKFSTDQLELAQSESSGEEKQSGSGTTGTLMLLIVVLFFIAAPQAGAAGLTKLFSWDLPVQSAGFQGLTGVIKLTIVIGYLSLIRRIPDIRRVFQYHGAEHKSISAYEAGEELTVQNAQRKTTLHPRCGTTFLVMVALISIVVFTAVGGLLPRIATGNAALDNVVFFLEKLPFLPLIVAFTFELQRASARYCTTGPLRALLWPGFLVQKITTIEPDDDQVEVALAALRATLFRESGAEVSERRDDVAFADYAAILRAKRLREPALASHS